MKKTVAVVLVLAAGLALAGPVVAQQDTLEKIKSSGVLTIGTRTGSPPFAYINKNNEWVGFTIDLVEMLVKPSVEKAVGKSIKVEKKESTPPTRIPLLTSNSVDLIAGTMTDTPQRRESVDFSLTFFYTGAQFLVKKGSPIKSIDSIAGKRIAAQQGSTNARIIRERVPTAKLQEFPDQPAAFQALVQGQVDAYTNDGIQLRAPRQGAEAERLEGGGRLLLLRAVRHGDAQERLRLPPRRQRRPDGADRVGQVLRALRQVVRAEERDAVPADGREQAFPHHAGRAEVDAGGAEVGRTAR